MDGLWSDHIQLVVCLLFVLCDHGNAAAKDTPCVPELQVRRNTVWNAVPLKQLTITCTCVFCQDVPRVTWCKMLENVKCKQVNETEDIKIRQKLFQKHLILFLDFKNISLDDQGQYRCTLAGSYASDISHAITVNVSESNRGLNNYSNTGDSTNQGRSRLSWLPYVCICCGILLVVITVTAISIYFLNGCKGQIISTNNKKKELAVSALPGPDLTSNPKGTLPSSPSNPNPNKLNNIYDHCGNDSSLQHSHQLTNGGHPSSWITAGGQESNQLVYAALNHHSPRGSPRSPHAPTPHDGCTEYAAIRVC
ncbi:hypothetical protein UPYG_G00306110 [Umbra pygmaea]|uniref:Ig-like domain-containing protein n=1 Tax=Umbra pygmaea TaxID=75934 RepID=A0ABD0W300_UMBPY